MLNTVMQNQVTKTTKTTSSRQACHGEHFWSALSQAATQNKWILFTGECARPTQSQLDRHNISNRKVIQLKRSDSINEIAVVMDAILAGTASAVVASNHIDYITQQQLRELGELENCSVFFTAPEVTATLH